MQIARDISIALALSLFMLTTTEPSTAQVAPQPAAPTTVSPPAPGIELDPLTEYPSMIPVLEIRMNLSDDFTLPHPPTTPTHQASHPKCCQSEKGQDSMGLLPEVFLRCREYDHQETP